MKISSLQENLKNGLFITGHIAGKNINLPILNNILIKAKEGYVKLVATDLEMGITTSIRGKIETEGVFTVDAKIISEYISLLPNQKIDINTKDSQLSIKSGGYKTLINGQTADEYPLIPQIDRKQYCQASLEKFKQALAQIIFAVSSSETRIELSGVLFVFNNNSLTMVATDSYRLAEKKIKLKTNINEEKKVIVPAKTLQEVARVLGGSKEGEGSNNNEIQFYISENQILFIMDNTELISRLIEGQYPDYKQIIPTRSDTIAIINKAELTRAIKAAAIFSKTGINDVSLDFLVDKKQIIISSASSQVGENRVELIAKITGKDNGIVVNHRYLLDGLGNVDSENVVVEVANGNTPCKLRAEKDDSYLYIIMPIKQ